MDCTKVGSIFNTEVGLVSRPRPLTSSLRNRCVISFNVSSEKRMEYSANSANSASLRNQGAGLHLSDAVGCGGIISFNRRMIAVQSQWSK
ncbi:hypothetical protein EYF80_037154 [Liparis tanakae]|uniref:Uncharacterized protein n=1 Tax=Liparis tanakae TaxID=230148 RepID=A0A4Z2GIN0_9TELE|nr:hypothetical protein EYF80_037154 [Liparis tanakae]